MRKLGRILWRFMIIFSFIVNFVLVAVLLVAGLFIFQIKQQVADPLITGLHSTATGLDEATIDWVIPVRDSLGIDLNVPINADTISSTVTEIAGQPVTAQIPGETVVTLTRAVPIVIQNANIDAGNLQLNNATVSITLPAGTELPVALDLAIDLVTDIPVELDVRAVIPLSETQLTDPFNQLGLLFEPLAVGLHNLPNDFNQAGRFAGNIWNGADVEQLLLSTDGTGFNATPYDPWTGFSITSGYNYEGSMTESYPPSLRPLETGLVVQGGIPALDQLLPDRADLYANDGTPADANDAAFAQLNAAGVPTYNYDGTFAEEYVEIQGEDPTRTLEQLSSQPVNVDGQSVPVGTGGSNPPATNSTTPDIIPTPSNP